MQIRTPEQIKTDNEVFAALVPAQQRVELAKDVIKQLQTRRFIAKAGIYFESDALDEMGTETNPELQTFFNEMSQCEVCAKGAMFVCLVDKKNSLKLLDVSSGSEYNEFSGTLITKYLRDLFELGQLELIESAFERDDMGSGYADEEDIQNAIFFGEKFFDDGSRLWGIMENIVQNNGKFVP